MTMNRAIPPFIETHSSYEPQLPSVICTANGFRLHCIEDHTQPLAFLSLSFYYGYTEGQPGLSYFASKMLTRGTREKSAETIADTIETWGGSLYTSIERDVFTISVSVLSRYFNHALALLAECVNSPSFDAQECEKLKMKVLADIERTESDPQSLAFRAAEEQLFHGHPYNTQWYGSKQAIQSFTTEQCRQWHNELMHRNGFFIASGDIYPDHIQRDIDTLFSSFDMVHTPEYSHIGINNVLRTHAIGVHRENSLQSTIITGLHVPSKRHPDFIPLRLLSAILGGEGLSSRLTMALREEKAYTYGAGCFIDDALQGTALYCMTSVGNDVTQDAIEEIFTQIHRLHHEPIPLDELERNKQSLIGKTLFSSETPKQRAYLAQFCEIHNLPLTYFKQRNEIMRDLQPEMLQTIAQRYLQPDKMIIAVCGDGETLSQHLQHFGSVILR